MSTPATSSGSGQTAPTLRGSRDKRSRSWDVDVSLDELVEWDALEQFMQDVPEGQMPRQNSGIGRLHSSEFPLSALGSRRLSHEGMGMGPGPMRSNSTESVTHALGLAAAQQHLVPGAWPMAHGLSGSLSGSLGSGLHGGLTGAASLNAAAHAAGLSGTNPRGLPTHGNAASLAQSLYSSWTLPGSAGVAGAPTFLQALPMERGVSWGAELLPDLAGLTNPLGNTSPTSSETQQGPGSGPGSASGVTVTVTAAQHAAAAAAAAASSHAVSMVDVDAGGRGAQKQRFVWTSELHRRFEAAVNTLGVDQAKPQVNMAYTYHTDTALLCFFRRVLSHTQSPFCVCCLRGTGDLPADELRGRRGADAAEYQIAPAKVPAVNAEAREGGRRIRRRRRIGRRRRRDVRLGERHRRIWLGCWIGRSDGRPE